jgi:phosphoribosylanthranilate isomerase
MRVKICGITRLEDALAACEAGADALGFVFYPPSPRYITPEAARAIADQLPPFVQRVGLFVDTNPDEVNRICFEAGIQLAQIHCAVNESYFGALKVPALKVVRADTPEKLEQFGGEYRLVDAHVAGFGGAGVRLPIAWFEGRDCSQMVLAGGLKPEDLPAIRPLGFYGVDVSSGVEKRRGVKDPEKICAFIRAAKGL